MNKVNDVDDSYLSETLIWFKYNMSHVYYNHYENEIFTLQNHANESITY